MISSVQNQLRANFKDLPTISKNSLQIANLVATFRFAFLQDIKILSTGMHFALKTAKYAADALVGSA
jgi:hypothetical protein